MGLAGLGGGRLWPDGCGWWLVHPGMRRVNEGWEEGEGAKNNPIRGWGEVFRKSTAPGMGQVAGLS